MSDTFHGVEESVATPQQIYTEKLHQKLEGMSLSDADVVDLKALAMPLSDVQMRAVHGRLYAEMLTEVCADGRVTQDEIDRLTALRVWLTTLGWCP